MAENKKQQAKREMKEALAILPEIVKASQSEAGCMYIKPVVFLPLVEEGLVEVNEAYVNEAGEYATRATTKGIEKVMSENVNVEEGVAITEVAKVSFVIENIPVVVAAKRGGGRGGTQYPFEALEVGQSFVVAATTKRPDPVKSLASTITAANKRYAVPVFEADGTTPKMKTVTNPKTKEKREEQATQLTRKFAISAVEGGARIGRIK